MIIIIIPVRPTATIKCSNSYLYDKFHIRMAFRQYGVAYARSVSLNFGICFHKSSTNASKFCRLRSEFACDFCEICYWNYKMYVWSERIHTYFRWAFVLKLRWQMSHAKFLTSVWTNRCWWKLLRCLNGFAHTSQTYSVFGFALFFLGFLDHKEMTNFIIIIQRSRLGQPRFLTWTHRCHLFHRPIAALHLPRHVSSVICDGICDICKCEHYIIINM